MSSVLQIAYEELAVSWEYDPQRVQEYIDVSSRSKVYDQVKSHSRSWCTDFAYWVIKQAGLQLPDKSYYDAKAGTSNSTARFIKRYTATNNPKSGDLYHMPYKANKKAVYHIGFVLDAVNYDQVLTLDGNSDYGGYWTHGLGGGWVCMNWRDRSLIHAFLKLPDA